LERPRKTPRIEMLNFDAKCVCFFDTIMNSMVKKYLNSSRQLMRSE
jgi:hypothetical protein